MKKCTMCSVVKDSFEFAADKRHHDGLQSHCRQCQRSCYFPDPEKKKMSTKLWRERNKEKLREYNRNWIKNNPEKKRKQRLRESAQKKKLGYPSRKDTRYHLWLIAKARARKRNIKFTITKSDIILVENCPILGLKLERSIGHARPNSPTLDRIIPHLGYIRGNIQVISQKANRMKSDASSTELLLFSKWINMTFDEKNQKEIAA